MEIESEDALLGSDITDAAVINYGKLGNLAPASLVDKYIKEKNPFFEYHLSKKDFKDLGNFFDQNNLHVYRGDPGELVTVDEIIPTLAQYLMEQLKGRQDKKSYELEDFSDLDKFMSDNGFVFKESGTYEIYPSDFLVPYIKENILTKKALEFQKYRIEKEDFEKFLEDPIRFANMEFLVFKEKQDVFESIQDDFLIPSKNPSVKDGEAVFVEEVSVGLKP